MEVFRRFCVPKLRTALFYHPPFRMMASKYGMDDTVQPIQKNQSQNQKKPFVAYVKKASGKEMPLDVNQDNKLRLQYQGLRIKPRGINYFSDEGVALTLDVTPAQYKNIDGSSYVVAKRGYFVMRWVEYNKATEEMNYSEKRDFIISPMNVDVILGIDAHNPKIDADGEVCFYEQTDDQVTTTKVLRIQQHESGDLVLMYAELQGEKKLTGEMMIRLKRGQFIVLQKMIEYALPSLYGWSAIYDPACVDN